MNLKTKRKTKIAILSTVLICIFVISFGVSVKAAADPVLTDVVYSSEYYEKDLPIKVSVCFYWEPNSAQRLEYVYMHYNVNSKALNYKLTYDWDDVVANARPVEVDFKIPDYAVRENDTVYFKISYIWHTLWGNDIIESPPELHKINVLYEGQKEADAQSDMLLYICLGGAGAVLLIALAFMYTMKRRR